MISICFLGTMDIYIKFHGSTSKSSRDILYSGQSDGLADCYCHLLELLAWLIKMGTVLYLKSGNPCGGTCIHSFGPFLEYQPLCWVTAPQCSYTVDLHSPLYWPVWHGSTINT